jgi:hypothetical protein
MDAGRGRGRKGIVGHGSLTLLAVFTLAGALIGLIAGAGERQYRAHAYVIRVPPAYASEDGLALARSRVGPHARVQLTGRGDFAITARAPSETEAVVMATAYAKAVKRSLPPEPGLATMGRGARRARRELGSLGSAMLGGAAGVWLGAAAAIVMSGSRRAPRRAGAPCAPATRATPG